MVTLAGAMLPALSVQTPDIVWLAPADITVTGAVQLTTPDNASVPEKVTVTGARYHPGGFAFAETLALAIGVVLSSFTVTEEDAVNPTPFVAEHVTTTAAVSWEIETEPHPLDELTPDSGSVALHETVTF
jgi:hypothetical protein